jgi:hypothetical protein
MKKSGKFSPKIILTFPRGFVFGVIAPLHLIHLDLASMGKTNVFFKNADRSFPVSEIGVQVDGVVFDLGEGFRFVWNLKAFAELRHVKDIMELRQF